MDPDVHLDESARRARAAAIDAQAARLNRLVSNLLDMSRIEAGDLHARLEVLPLDDLVRAGVERTVGELEGRRVAIAIPEELPPVAVDAILFDQVLTNLLENAVRHTPPEAPIRVAGALTRSGMVRLSVEDGGPGVPAAAVEHLFDKFYRGPAPAGRSRIGSGLGLAVVRGFVEAMGGSVAARPSELGGLAVDVELRAATQPASVPPDGAAREAVTR